MALGGGNIEDRNKDSLFDRLTAHICKQVCIEGAVNWLELA
jgi:hypothetical protein